MAIQPLELTSAPTGSVPETTASTTRTPAIAATVPIRVRRVAGPSAAMSAISPMIATSVNHAERATVSRSMMIRYSSSTMGAR